MFWTAKWTQFSPGSRPSLRMNGQAKLDTPFQLLYEIGSRSVGDEIALKVSRNGETLPLTAKLGARPDRYRE